MLKKKLKAKKLIKSSFNKWEKKKAENIILKSLKNLQKNQLKN
jgi:hypothetical protein